MATKQQVPVLVARLVEFQEEFLSLSTEDAQWAIMNGKEAASLLSEAIANRVNRVVKEVKNIPITRLISDGKNLTLKALDGTRLFANSLGIFKSFVDCNFVRWGLNKKGIATPVTPIRVDEMQKNGTFLDIFRSLPGTLNQKKLTQNQVIEFCLDLPEWLNHDGLATFFLVPIDESIPIDEEKPEANSVVIYVRADVNSHFGVNVLHLESSTVWYGKNRHRVVYPRLETRAYRKRWIP